MFTDVYLYMLTVKQIQLPAKWWQLNVHLSWGNPYLLYSLLRPFLCFITNQLAQKFKFFANLIAKFAITSLVISIKLIIK